MSQTLGGSLKQFSEVDVIMWFAVTSVCMVTARDQHVAAV